MEQVRENRGAALVAVLMAGIIFSIAAFAALTMALSGRQRSRQSSEGRLRAQYAAEAGLAWAMQKLWANPSECFPGASDFSLDTDGSGPLPPTSVNLIATPCPPADSTLQATVTY